METAVVSDSPRKAGYFTPMVLSELASDVNAAAANWPLMVWRRYLPSKVTAGARRLFVVANGPNGEEYARCIECIVDRYVMSTDPVEMLQAVVAMADMFRTITPLAFDLDQAGHARQYRKMGAPDPDALQIPIDPSWITEPQDADEEVEERQEPKSLDDLDPAEVHHIMEVLAAALLSPETLIKIQFVMPPSEGGRRARAHRLAHRASPKARAAPRASRTMTRTRIPRATMTATSTAMTTRARTRTAMPRARARTSPLVVLVPLVLMSRTTRVSMLPPPRAASDER